MPTNLLQYRSWTRVRKSLLSNEISCRCEAVIEATADPGRVGGHPHDFPLALQAQARSAHHRTSSVVPSASSRWTAPGLGPRAKASTPQRTSEPRASSKVVSFTWVPSGVRLTVDERVSILMPGER